LSFSWLGYFFGGVWGVYHKVPYTYFISLFPLFFFPILFLVDEGLTEIIVGIYFAGFVPVDFVILAVAGRTFLIGSQFSLVVEDELSLNVQRPSKWAYLGIGFSNPWIRVLMYFVTYFVLFAMIGAGYLALA
jgi:hypothetical protein